MKKLFRQRRSILALLSLASLLLGSLTVAASHTAGRAHESQRREHLTPQEIDRVRDAQVLDRRIAVFIKAAERRLSALTDPAWLTSRQAQKEVEEWGEIKGTRAELISDLAGILDEAITNIDDVSARTPRSSLIPKALKKLAEASARFLTQLIPMRDRAPEGPEREALEQAIDHSQAIIEAAKKLER